MKYESIPAEVSADDVLKDRILSALKSVGVPSARNVSVEVHGGEIFLRGEVVSFYAKQVLQHSARRLAGDNPVIDEIRVVTPAAHGAHLAHRAARRIQGAYRAHIAHRFAGWGSAWGPYGY